MIDVRKVLEEGTFTSFDVEADGRPNQLPVEISFCVFDKGRFVDEHYFRLNSGRSINEHATAVHGITDEDVKDCPQFADVEDEIREIMTSSVLVGHDCLQDIQIISRHLPEAQILPLAIIDTFRMGKKLREPGSQGRLRVVDIAERSGVEAINAPKSLRRFQLHSSSFDAWLTGMSAVAMASKIETDWKARQNAYQLFAHHIKPKVLAELQEIVDNRTARTNGPKI